MSEKRRDKDYLCDIAEAIRRILSYTKGLTWDGFLADNKTQDAVVRNLEVIGEATKSLSAPLREKCAHIPWKDLAGLRDKLIHHYFGVKYEIVWRIARENLPALLPKIEQILIGL
jgi:uncharacterized protein with HEPN domain